VLEGIATEEWNLDAGEITDLSWSAMLSQRNYKGTAVTWMFQSEVLSISATDAGTNVSAVPVLGAFWLMGSALVGMFGLQKRNKKA